MRRLFIPGLCLALLMPLLSACGDGDSTATPTTDSTVPGATTKPANLPAGWKPFNEGDYTGGIAPTWETTLINGADLLKPGSTSADAIPQEFRDGVVKAAQQGQFKEMLFVFISKTPGKASNINMTSCQLGTQTLSELAKQYDTAKVVHADAGMVPFAGKSTPIMRVEVGATLDTYQAIAQGQTCYAVVTLTVPKGDSEGPAQFKQFMAALQLKK